MPLDPNPKLLAISRLAFGLVRCRRCNQRCIDLGAIWIDCNDSEPFWQQLWRGASGNKAFVLRDQELSKLLCLFFIREDTAAPFALIEDFYFYAET